MPQYIIEISEEHDQKLRSEFPEPEMLFKKVVADAVQAADHKAIEDAKPAVVRISDEAITVSIEALATEDLSYIPGYKK